GARPLAGPADDCAGDSQRPGSHLQRRFQDRLGRRRLLPKRRHRGHLAARGGRPRRSSRRGGRGRGGGGGPVGMPPQGARLRQNLRLIVDHGVVPSSVDQDVESSWGATLGGSYHVWRSGIGVTADGRVIFVYAPALDVQSLADLLRRAGCVEAMQLDINPDWMSFMYYLPEHHPANPTPINLLPDQVQPADRYYAISNRDFTAVYAK